MNSLPPDLLDWAAVVCDYLACASLTSCSRRPGRPLPAFAQAWCQLEARLRCASGLA
jgi:hypothetical protein